METTAVLELFYTRNGPGSTYFPSERNGGSGEVYPSSHMFMPLVAPLFKRSEISTVESWFL